MTPRRFALLLLFATSCARPSPPASSPSGSLPVPTPPTALGAAAWDHLKTTLPGTWTMPGKIAPFVVRYKLISSGTALVEEWGPGTSHETRTVFAPDHAELLLTHYCAQGNQPRLRVVSSADDAIVFRFVDVTNLAPDEGMLVERTLRLGAGVLEDTETYRGSDGRDETTTYRFTRAEGAM